MIDRWRREPLYGRKVAQCQKGLMFVIIVSVFLVFIAFYSFIHVANDP